MRTDDKISKYLNGFICLAAKGCVKAEVSKEKPAKEGKKTLCWCTDGVAANWEKAGRDTKAVYIWARQHFFKFPVPQKTY